MRDLTDLNEVILPRLIGSRQAARRLLVAEAPLAGQTVVLNARELRSASPSAADEFVRVSLVEGDAQALEVVGGTPDFNRDLEASAQAHGVLSQLHELSPS